MKYFGIHILIAALAILIGEATYGLKLTSFVSQRGIRGYITFEQQSPQSAVKIKVDLQSAFVHPIRLSLDIREFPVDYRKEMEERCSESEIGGSVLNLDKVIGELTLPDNASELLTTTKFSLTGKSGIWGRSLLLSFVEGEPDSPIYQLAGCGTITVDGDFEERVAEVRFYYPVAGSIWFRWLGSSSVVDAVIYNEGLFSIGGSLDKMAGKFTHSGSLPSDHGWQVFASDILDSEADKSRANCNFLQILFDPDSRDDTSCSPENSGSCKAGDLTRKLGKITVQANPGSKIFSTSSKRFFRDPHFPMPTELSTNAGVAARSLYVVLYDSRHEDSFLACARLRRHHPRVVLANAPGLPRVRLTQYSPFEPTRMDVNATPALAASVLSSGDTYLRIHELPVPPVSGLGATVIKPSNLTVSDLRCSDVGYVFNPKNDAPTDSPSPRPGGGTQDRYSLGDLGGKHGLFPVGVGIGPRTMWDAYLPLHGKDSVVHRALVAHKTNTNQESLNGPEEEPLACASLVPEEPVITAVAQFQYPAVGRILFRQVTGDPWADTSVLVEYLTYTDGSKNDTDGHRWSLSESPIGRDFYNWSERCVSAGPRNNPYKILPNSGYKGKEPGDCKAEYIGSALICAQGDLGGRHGTLKVAGGKANSPSTRKFFTDSHLPLGGAHSIIGHSVVLYDDFGPKARGERLGCATIGWHHRLKAVAKEWFASGEGGGGTVSPVRGKVEMIQQSEYDDTDVEVTFDGLDGEERGYYVHEASVEIQQEFPCEESSLYGTWDPFHAERNYGKRESWAIGDLSGKHGSLDGLEKTSIAFNDTQLPLYGVLSVIGRSVIIHKGKMSRRWACSTIERGYSPSEARELRAIASFHHPKGFAYGYIRMTQLIYNDGSKSDTAIEVKLRHPGKNDRNFTQNHNWAIFVNPVGQDAAVQTFNTRCVAGGYRWNPYYNQLADPLNDELYRAECGPDNPLRCDVGDISGRLGPIHLGGRRQLFNDVNLPLEGKVSAIGKSIVIYNKDGGGERFACANIEPDKDIIKYANIRKPPRFVTAQFIDDVREIMGLPEWMLTVDSRRTKVLHGGACIQFLLHFKGPLANQLEQDFSHLMGSGKLAQPSLYIPGALPNAKRRTHLAYRPCGTRDPNEKKFGSQLPHDGGAFYTSDTAEASKTHYSACWPPILHAAALGLVATKEDKDKSGKMPNMEPDHFHLLFGICMESLCGPRSSSEPKESVTTCLNALQTLLSSPSGRSLLLPSTPLNTNSSSTVNPASNQQPNHSALPDRSLAIELCNVLHRLVLTREWPEVHALAMEVVGSILKAGLEALETYKRKVLKEISPANRSLDDGIGMPADVEGEADITPGQSLAFALLEVCLCLMLRYYPHLAPNSPDIPPATPRPILSGSVSLDTRPVANALYAMQEIPRLCSPQGAVAVLPTILYLATGVLGEGGETSEASLRCLFSLCSDRNGHDSRCAKEWSHLLQSAMAKVLDLVSATGLPGKTKEDTQLSTLMKAFSTIALNAPPQVASAYQLCSRATDVLKSGLKGVDSRVRLECMRVLRKIFSHEEVMVSTPYMRNLTPILLEIVCQGVHSGRSVEVGWPPNDSEEIKEEEEIATLLEGMVALEAAVGVALQPHRRQLFGLLIPSLINCLLEGVSFKEASQHRRFLHEQCLQHLMRIGPQYPQEFKSLMAHRGDLRQRLESAIRLKQNNKNGSEGTEGKGSSSCPRSLMLPPRPTIQLKTDFSNFTA